jgi:hypothetical protein
MFLYPSVLSAFVPFNKRFEGYVPWMYADVKNLVTTGMGNLIDGSPDANPEAPAVALGWHHERDGSKATPAEIVGAWHAVKNAGLAGVGGGSPKFAALSDLRLDDSAIQQLIDAKVAQNDAILNKRFAGYHAWPADAQLGAHSISWAAGGNFNFPRFQAEASKLVPNFNILAKESYMNDTRNPGLKPRNVANQILFTNAQRAVDQGLAFDELIYDVESAISSVLSAAGTLSGAAVKAATTKTGIAISLIVGGGVALAISKLLAKG